MMAEIWVLLIACTIIWYFNHLRKVAEKARKVATQHCEQLELQFIAIARVKTRFSASKRLGIFVKSDFQFEFSGDGESSYKGILHMHGLKPAGFDMPAYKF